MSVKPFYMILYFPKGINKDFFVRHYRTTKQAPELDGASSFLQDEDSSCNLGNETNKEAGINISRFMT